MLLLERHRLIGEMLRWLGEQGRFAAKLALG